MSNDSHTDLFPVHPAIDSESLGKSEVHGRKCRVLTVTCPRCGTQRVQPVGVLRSQLKAGSFTGACAGCSRSGPALPPSRFDIEYLGARVVYGQRVLAARLNCPACGEARIWPMSILRTKLADHAFTGLCRRCHGSARNNTLENAPPCVDLSSTRIMEFNGQRLTSARVTCPVCSADRWLPLGDIRKRLKSEIFTGRCGSCRQKTLTRLDLEFSHPTIDASRIRRGEVRGITCSVAPVTCPDCLVQRWVALSDIRVQFKKGAFTGRCRPCGMVHIRAGLAKHLATLPPSQPRITDEGYRELPRNSIPAEDQWLFDAMVNKAHKLLEHRLVMAKFLGRPLRSDERVDHRNGQKLDNDIDNLRLYITNQNDPGSCPGSGVYYDEWQRAEAQVRRLEARVAELESQLTSAEPESRSSLHR